MVSWLVPLRTLRFAELPLRPAGRTTAAVFVGGGGGSVDVDVDLEKKPPFPGLPKHMINPWLIL